MKLSSMPKASLLAFAALGCSHPAKTISAHPGWTEYNVAYSKGIVLDILVPSTLELVPPKGNPPGAEASGVFFINGDPSLKDLTNDVMVSLTGHSVSQEELA